MDGLRSRLTYANVMASIAVFIALGGGTYAASRNLVVSNGVVHACVSKHGSLTVVRAKQKCPRHSQAIALDEHATGPAGGDLTGSYPNPSIAGGSVTPGKLAPLGAWIPVDLSGMVMCGPSSTYKPYGNGFAAPAYRRDAYGVVHLRGALGCQPNTGSPPAGETLFDLPAGYRPIAAEEFSVTTASDPTFNSTSFLIATVEVDADGTVSILGNHQQKFISLSGIEFDTLR